VIVFEGGQYPYLSLYTKPKLCPQKRLHFEHLKSAMSMKSVTSA
jgi:hypothetical protein